MKTKLAIVFALCIGLIGCNSAWTERERDIIRTSDSLMYVTTIPADSSILRAQSIDLGPRELDSPELKALIAKMLHTVTDPSQDGVGIAAPQVGINRRIILVQRFDKPGEPFEAYVNVKVDSLAGDIVIGPEGCLSVPGLRGLVKRHSKIGISYTDISSIYIDRADSVYVSD